MNAAREANQAGPASTELPPKMSVLEVVASSIGGAAVHLLTLVSGMDRSHFQIAVAMAGDGGHVHPDDFLRLGIPCTTAPLNSILPLRSLLFLRRLVRKNRFDIIHAHGLRAGLLVRLSLLGFSKRPAVICSIHGLHIAYYESALRRLLVIWLEKALKPMTSAWLCASESDAANAIRLGIASADRVSVVVNAVDSGSYQLEARDSLVLRGELQLIPRQPVIATVARLHPQKDLPSLLKAMRILKDKIPDARLLIVGDGPQYGALVQLARDLQIIDRVTFLGSRRDIPVILKACDVFALSTRWEATSIAILEAMAMAKPVVASHVDGVCEVVIDQETGILVPPQDPEAFAEALIHLLTHPELAIQMGQHGLSRVQEVFTVERLVSAVAEIYARCSEKTSSSHCL